MADEQADMQEVNEQEAINGGNEQEASEVPASWDDFISAQPEPVRQLYDKSISKLEKSLSSERDTRKDLEKQIKRLSSELEAGSELKGKVDLISSDLKETGTRMKFMESAHENGVDDLRLAYLAAKEYALLDEDGECDFGKLREKAPGLWPVPKAAVPSTNAGRGSGAPARTESFNDLIRRRAGYA
jgi:hypothetical protein